MGKWTVGELKEASGTERENGRLVYVVASKGRGEWD